MNTHMADSVHIPSVGFRLFSLSTTSSGNVGGKKRSNVLSKGENVFEEGQETQFLDLKDTNNVFW